MSTQPASATIEVGVGTREGEADGGVPGEPSREGGTYQGFSGTVKILGSEEHAVRHTAVQEGAPTHCLSNQ